jgi:ribose transport system substrate-binding protein
MLSRKVGLCLVALIAGAASRAWADSKPTVGVLFKSRTGFWALAEKGALAAGEELGVQVVVKGAPSMSNPAWQVNLLKSLIEQKLDALVVSPVKVDTLDAELRQAVSQGTKLVAFDVPSWSDIASVSIEPDRVGVAKGAAKTMVALVEGNDEVILFRNNQRDLPVVQREEMLIQEIKHLRPDLVIHADVYANTAGVEAGESASFALSKYPKAKAILSTSTQGTMAMLDVLKAKALEGKIKLVGFGTNLNPRAADAIEAGIMDGWVAQLPYDLGYQCVASAAAVIRGKDIPKTLKDPSLIVTRDNLHEPKVQALLKL